jgi:hypothetical protein
VEHDIDLSLMFTLVAASILCILLTEIYLLGWLLLMLGINTTEQCMNMAWNEYSRSIRKELRCDEYHKHTVASRSVNEIQTTLSVGYFAHTSDNQLTLMPILP